MTGAEEPRIAPLPPSDWTREILDATAPMRPPEGSAAAERRSEIKGSVVVNALATLLRHPPLAGAFFAFNRHLLYESSLSERERELAILRVAWLRSCDYEWAQHVETARHAGIAAEELERLAQDDGGQGWSAIEAYLISAVDELVADARVSDDTWNGLRAARDEAWLMDLVFTIGGYETLAFAFNSFGIELDPGLERHRL